MEFNNTKFECLRYGCNNDLKACTSYKAKSGECITEVDNAKDLGVTLSSNGNFKEHIKNVLSTATQLCGWVLRTFNTRKTLPMMTLWKALIRSRLDYCCQLWSPSKKGDVQALEQLQRQYIRKISGVQHLTYWQQLKYLSLNSLERRRERYIIMYVWSILERHTPNFDLPGNCGINCHWHIRRGRYCLVPRVSHQASSTIQTIRYGSFAVRGPMLFNTLPSELRNMTNCSSKSFKQALDTFLKTIPDEPQIPGYTYMRRAESNSLIHMTPLTTARHPSISEELDNMPQARGGHPWSPRDWTRKPSTSIDK